MTNFLSYTSDDDDDDVVVDVDMFGVHHVRSSLPKGRLFLMEGILQLRFMLQVMEALLKGQKDRGNGIKFLIDG